MTATTIPEDVRDYLHRVRERLADLPPEEREDLLADVEPSVLDSAGESDAPVELRLGPPERFADELRAAAGLPPRAGTPVVRPSLRRRIADLAADVRWTRARELAPLWWVVRAYVAVAALSIVVGSGLSSAWPGFPTFGTGLAGGVVLAAVVVASVAVGLRRRPRGHVWTAVNVIVALSLVPVLASVPARGTTFVEVPADAPVPAGLSYDGVPVDNVFAYDRGGRLLQDVRLYGNDGRPLEIGRGAPDPARRVPRTADGARAYNAFPIRYFEPGTERVVDPDAGAPPAPAALATKPLDASRRAPARRRDR